MGGDGSGLRVPAAVAVTAWFASALAVLGYTAIAFAETANGNSTPQFDSPPGGAPLLHLKPTGIKPSDIGFPTLGSGKKYLKEVPPLPGQGGRTKTYGITPAELGFGKRANRGKFAPSPGANRRGILGNQK